MSEQILKLIYDFTKNYNDPSSKQALDENNKNLSIVIKNGNINLSLTIDPSQKNNYDELVNILKTNIANIKGVLSVHVILTSEKTSNHSNQENKRFKINTKKPHLENYDFNKCDRNGIHSQQYIYKITEHILNKEK